MYLIQVAHDVIIYKFQIPIIVHEAICISIWREKVLPLLLKIAPEPNSIFVPYMVVSKNLVYSYILRTYQDVLGHNKLSTFECFFQCQVTTLAPPLMTKMLNIGSVD